MASLGPSIRIKIREQSPIGQGIEPGAGAVGAGRRLAGGTVGDGDPSSGVGDGASVVAVATCWTASSSSPDETMA